MDAATYRELAYGGRNAPTWNVADVREAIAECTRCHGADGRGRSPSRLSLAGQNEAYLLESLRAYADWPRPSGVMACRLSRSIQDSCRRS